MSLDLQEALEHLYGLERRKDKLDLEGTRALLGALGNPERRFRSVHVAGTNGKGTTCALIERMLREAGVRTGLYTSPHLVDFRERIRVNGRWADERRLAKRLEHIQSLPEGRDRTFFEVCTALAFDDFAARGVEWAVVEVGLGGRLDCTNVITPEVCAITSIGRDHTEILGDTIDAIAREKAGIVKPGVPLVIGPMPPAAREAIARIAAERGAPLQEAAPARGARAADRGAFRSLNLGTALEVLDALRERGLDLPDAAIERGLLRARWPGRLEHAERAPRLWWDGAHNPEGAAALAAEWKRRMLPVPGAIVLAFSRDKNVEEMAMALAPIAEHAAVFATRTRGERALDPAVLGDRLRATGVISEPASSVAEACRTALAATAPPGLVLLTGSLFAVGEAMEAFGGAPGAQL